MYVSYTIIIEVYYYADCILILTIDLILIIKSMILTPKRSGLVLWRVKHTTKLQFLYQIKQARW